MPSFVPLSACVSDASESRCAIEPAQCPAGFTFQLDNVSLFTHTSCNDIEDIETGRCDDTGRCAYNAEGCKNPASYQDPTVPGVSPQGCTIGVDKDSGDFVIHSKCNRNGQQLCHVGDCSDGVVTPHVKECHCGAVWTGACVDEISGKHFCAVDADACDGTDAVFQNAHELWKARKIDCRLCSHLYYEHPGSKEISTGVAFGLGIALGAIPVLILGICYMTCRRRRTAKTNAEENGDATNGTEMS